MHFCVSATRGGFQGGLRSPKKIGMNWFIPAFVKSRLGASGSSEDDGTIVCLFSPKKSRKLWRISRLVIKRSEREPRSRARRRHGNTSLAGKTAIARGGTGR